MRQLAVINYPQSFQLQANYGQASSHDSHAHTCTHSRTHTRTHTHSHSHINRHTHSHRRSHISRTCRIDIPAGESNKILLSSIKCRCTHTHTRTHTHKCAIYSTCKNAYDDAESMTRFANTSCSAFMMAKMNAPLLLSVITEMQQVPSEIASTQMADKYGARTMAALRENQQQQRQQELSTVFLCKFTRNCNRLVALRAKGARRGGTEHDPQRVDG